MSDHSFGQPTGRAKGGRKGVGVGSIRKFGGGIMPILSAVASLGDTLWISVRTARMLNFFAIVFLLWVILQTNVHIKNIVMSFWSNSQWDQGHNYSLKKWCTSVHLSNIFGSDVTLDTTGSQDTVNRFVFMQQSVKFHLKGALSLSIHARSAAKMK